MQQNSKYDAFISYSSKIDRPIATQLHKALEKFAKPWYKMRRSRIFHDSTGLNATETLWPRLEQAINDSRHFILLASPQAASSAWVQREVTTRINQKLPILIVLTRGKIVWDSKANDFAWKHTTALPRCLSHYYEYEPLYVDIRWIKDPKDTSLRHSKFHDTIATLASTILGIDKDELSSTAVKQHRITLRLAWSAIILLTLLFLGTLYQTIAVSKARNLAERRLDDALEVAEHIVLTIDQDLLTIAGGSEVRKKLLQSGRNLLEKLKRESSSDAKASSARLKRASLLEHRKRGLLALTNENLITALKEFNSAYELSKSLLKQKRLSAANWLDCAQAAESLAFVNRRQGNYGESRRFLDEAYGILTYLIKEKPRYSLAYENMSLVYTEYFHLEKTLGNISEAEENGKKALELDQLLAAQYPDDINYLMAPAYTLNRMGDLFLNNAQPNKAKPYFEKALQLRIELLSIHPNNVILIYDVASSYSRIGKIALYMGELKNARLHLLQAIQLTEALVKAEHDNNEYLQLHASLYDLLGQVADSENNTASARNYYQKYRSISDTLSARDKSSVTFAINAIYAALRLGDFESKYAQYQQANKQYNFALTTASGLLKKHPSNVEIRRILALSQYRAGTLALNNKQTTLARQFYLNSLENSQSLSKSVPNNIQYRIDIAQAYRRLGDVAFAEEDLTKADKLYTQALQVSRGIYSDSADPQIQINLISQLLGLGKIKYYKKEKDSAIRLCQEAIDISELLVQQAPGNPTYASYLKQSKEYLNIVNE